MMGGMVSEILFYTCLLLDAPHIFRHVVGLLHQCEDNTPFSGRCGNRDMANSLSRTITGRSVFCWTMETPVYLMSLQRSRCIFPSRSSVMQEKPKAFCSVRSACVRVSTARKRFNSSAVRLDLTGIAVFTHISEQSAYHVPVHLFQQNVYPLCLFQIGSNVFAYNALVLYYLLAVAFLDGALLVFVTPAEPCHRLCPLVFFRLLLAFKSQWVEYALSLYLPCPVISPFIETFCVECIVRNKVQV